MAHIELMDDSKFELYVEQFSEEKRKRLREERERLLKANESEKTKETEEED